MPTPVKGPFPVAAPTPSRSGAAAPAESPAGETFQQELVRRRGSDRQEAAQAARKAEPKRETKVKKPARPGRGEPGAEPEEVEVRQTSAREQGEAPPPEEVVEAVDAADVAHGDGEPADGDRADVAEESEDPAAAAAALLAGAVVAPAIEADAEGVSQDADVHEVLIPPRAAHHDLTARATVDVPGATVDAGEGGEAASGGEAVGDMPAFLAQTLSDAGGEDAGAGQQGEHRGGATQPAIELPDDLADPGDGEAFPSFQLQGSSPGPDVAPHVDADFVAAAMGDVKAEARIGASPAGLSAAPALPPEARFAAANHETIVTSMRGELLPSGGSMRIRLDPPQLGALQVTVVVEDGLVTAAFETSNDEATRLLGHSLNQLKTALESHGVAVDKLQVQQAPREAQTPQPNNEGRREQGGQSQEQEHSARQEQQRREMLRKLWQRLTGGQDPLDLTA